MKRLAANGMTATSSNNIHCCTHTHTHTPTNLKLQNNLCNLKQLKRKHVYR